jgi:5-methylcytosine-specific restriction enzyme B
MALYTLHHDAPAVVAAARQWVERSLIGDLGVFTDERISTKANFDALDTYFVKRPEAGSGSFYQKLTIQLEPAPRAARLLMAELLWALFLFPSNITPDKKREGIASVLGTAGVELPYQHSLLSNPIMEGIGSGGMGVNSNRWREMNFIVSFGQAVKALPAPERARVLTGYDAFVEWIRTVPQSGERQFRHMLRYLLFPERVERMSSNGDRRKVLDAFGVASLKETRKWSDRELDDALLALREAQAQMLGTEDIDFYLDPLRSRWKRENETDEDVAEEPVDDEVPVPAAAALPGAARKPFNRILYGPPGTGKTWTLKQQYFKDYVEKAADLDRAAWLQQIVTDFGWRAVVAAALADIGKPAKADVVEAHELVAAKALQRQRSRNLTSTVWGYLQLHASAESKTVNVAGRRAPFLFDKDKDSRWFLLTDWRTTDTEAAGLDALYKAGQKQGGSDVHRYRMVTFHPSYTYEDFVVGLRPVLNEESEDGGVVFRRVAGVFKQVCDDARANPDKRYALFIDEINRASTAKVFGELITLIELDKRARYDEAGNLVAGMEVQLPGTSPEDGRDAYFGVPENLDIIGTMNTADRSIALLDIALRRRFEFQELTPRYDVIQRKVGTIELAALLRRINDRIEFLADRNRLIGHGYFTRVSTLDELRVVFRDQVIPLLQEYFFDDFGRVEQVLSDAKGRSPFLARESLQPASLFAGKAGVGGEARTRYVLTPESSWTDVAFRSLYEAAPADA